MRQLPAQSHPNLLVGTDHFDDAGVYRITDTVALVQTLDFFPPLVDDPFTFGRIAAANSFSDIYAMGGTPITAMNIVGFPDKELPADVLSEILRGGCERAAAAGAVIVGGHSVRDAEVKYGMAVTGTIDPARIITNSGAKVGDKLVLTKPIGSGVLTSAAKANKIPESRLAEAIEVMVTLNRTASDAMCAADAHAATDITGFGLIGHAYEMASGSDVTIRLDSRMIPLLTDTMRFAGEGILTRAHKATLSYLGDKFCATGVDETLVAICADAQTSGGLLIAVAPDRCKELVKNLERAKTPCAAIIGEVLPGAAHAVLVT